MCYLFWEALSPKTETRGHEHRFLLSRCWFHRLPNPFLSVASVSPFLLVIGRPEPEHGLPGERLRARVLPASGPELEADASLGKGFLPRSASFTKMFLHVYSHSLMEMKVILWLATAAVPTCLLGDLVEIRSRS